MQAAGVPVTAGARGLSPLGVSGQGGPQPGREVLFLQRQSVPFISTAVLTGFPV